MRWDSGTCVHSSSGGAGGVAVCGPEIRPHDAAPLDGRIRDGAYFASENPIRRARWACRRKCRRRRISSRDTRSADPLLRSARKTATRRGGGSCFAAGRPARAYRGRPPGLRRAAARARDRCRCWAIRCSTRTAARNTASALPSAFQVQCGSAARSLLATTYRPGPLQNQRTIRMASRVPRSAVRSRADPPGR